MSRWSSAFQDVSVFDQWLGSAKIKADVGLKQVQYWWRPIFFCYNSCCLRGFLMCFFRMVKEKRCFFFPMSRPWAIIYGSKNIRCGDNFYKPLGPLYINRIPIKQLRWDLSQSDFQAKPVVNWATFPMGPKVFSSAAGFVCFPCLWRWSFTSGLGLFPLWLGKLWILWDPYDLFHNPHTTWDLFLFVDLLILCHGRSPFCTTIWDKMFGFIFRSIMVTQIQEDATSGWGDGFSHKFSGSHERCDG